MFCMKKTSDKTILGLEVKKKSSARYVDLAGACRLSNNGLAFACAPRLSVRDDADAKHDGKRTRDDLTWIATPALPFPV